jgi:hypothetical protein
MVALSRPKLQAPLRRALRRLMGGEPGVEPIQSSAHHRTVAFRRAIVAQQITPICAITWVICGVAKCRYAHQNDETDNRPAERPVLAQAPIQQL